MKILNKLTTKNLLLNKRRTIVTIIGIILSCALICGTTTLVSSFQNSLIEWAKEKRGEYHIQFYQVPKEEQKYLVHNQQAKKISIMQNIGYAYLEGSQNEYKPYLFLSEYDNSALNGMGIELLEGRLPTSSHELLIPEHILKNGKVKFEIGDKIKLSIGKRILGNEDLTQANPFLPEEGEELIIEEEKEYEIVGIMSRLSNENYSAPGYTCISYLEEPKEFANVAMLLKNPKQVYSLKDEYTYESSYNSELLRYEGVTQNDSINTTLIVISSIIIFIIVVTSVFVIRNSFSISITERTRQYGMLSSIGATSKQIRKNVLFEGFLLGLIAVPIGVLSGIFAIWILLMIVDQLVGSFLGITLHIFVSMPAVFIAIAISVLTIFLSTIIPARRAGRVAPIDAIRSSNDIKIKGKKLKIPKIFAKLFGIEGEIALKNLKRSKKKYRTTIVSISLSIIIFIAFSSFIEYGFKVTSAFYEDPGFDFQVNAYGDTDEETLAYYKEIISLPNVDKYSINKTQVTYVDPNTYGTTLGKENITLFSFSKGDELLELLDVQLVILDQPSYQQYIKQLNGNLEEYKGKGILIDRNLTIQDDKRIEYQTLNVEEGDSIVVSLADYEQNKFLDKKIMIQEKTDICPIGVYLTGSPKIIVEEGFLDETSGINYPSLYLIADNPDKLEEEIDKIETTIEKNISNISEYARQEKAMILVISIFLYGFISVISIIGVTNIFNTISTNMALRSKEFAILKSIGMTSKEFNKMVNFESFFYGIKALLFGIPLGLIFSYLIYQGIGNMYITNYIPPYQAIIISVLFVFIIISLTMHYSTRKAKKQNIIETIRNENI